jgi:CheY-like chemotaxis protein
VDDDPLVVKVYAERMRYEGWIVAVARDGWEACQEANRSHFDMILLDIRMPFHNGVEVLQEIRSGNVNRVTPIYVLTGLTEGDAVDEALRLGADGVFFKSNTRPDELVRKVGKILESSPKERLRNSDQMPAVAPEPISAVAPEQVPAATPEPLPATVPEAEPVSAAAPAHAVPAGTGVPDDEITARIHGPGETPAAVPDDFLELDSEPGADFGAEETVELDPQPEPEPEPEVDLRELERDFEVYVNPFLGSGALLSKALGLAEIYQCGECGGQVCMKLTRDPRLDGKAIVGYFLCSRCGVAV